MTECPFRAVARLKAEEWLLEVGKPKHNHEAIGITGHPVHGKEALTETVSKFIANETQIHVRPGQILNALRLDDPDIPLAIKDVYNEKGKQRLERLNWKKPIQALMAELSRQEDWYSAHAEDGVHRLSHLFFANMESLRLLFLNPEVLNMDCTYKTNRFQMPLLSILGITSINRTFWVAFCFLRNEKEVDYTWVLNHVKALKSFLLIGHWRF